MPLETTVNDKAKHHCRAEMLFDPLLLRQQGTAVSKSREKTEGNMKRRVYYMSVCMQLLKMKQAIARDACKHARQKSRRISHMSRLPAWILLSTLI